MADYTISSIVTPNGDVCHIKPYNLEVGARNLLRFSLNPIITYTGGNGGYQRKQTVDEWGCTNAFRVYGTSGSSRAFYIGGQSAAIANGKNVSESGQSYAMSVWVKNAHATNSVIVCTPLGGEHTLAPGESARCAFVVEGDGLHNLEIDFKPTAPPSEYDVYFWHAKIEIGTVATDWLPAPEDADESYVASTGKPTEDQTPGFGEAVEVSQVKTDSGGRVYNLTTKTITIPDAEATTSEHGLMSAVDKKKLDELEVGGRNLLLKSAEPTIHINSSLTYTISRDVEVSEWHCQSATRITGSGTSTWGSTWGSLVFYIGGADSDFVNGDNVAKSGQKYTFSMFIKNNHASNLCKIILNPTYSPGVEIIEPGESKYFVQTVEGDGVAHLQINLAASAGGADFDISVWHPQIELGTFATDWTPATEDIPSLIPLASAMQNGLLSVLDWPKLQFNMIPQYTNMDYYSFNMGFHYASAAVARTLTNYPTSDDSVMLCIGEPDYQYQIVIEVDRSAPKIYGRPIYFYEPWTAWKQLHWFDTATTSSDGLMSAADKTKLDALEVGGRNLLLYSAEPIVYSAYSTINVTRNISVPEWGATNATRVVGSGGSNMYVCRVGGNTVDMAYGKNVGVNGKNYTISLWIKNNHATNKCGVRTNLPYDPGYTMLNPGESMKVEQTAVGNGSTMLCMYFCTGNLGENFDFTIWHPKIEEGTFATDWTPAPEDKADNALASSSNNGLMSASDKAQMIGMPGYNLLPGYVTEKTSSSSGNAFLGIPTKTIFTGLEGMPVAISFDVKGNAGDVLRVYAYQSSGLSIDVLQTDPVTFTLTADWKRVSFLTTVKQWPGTLNDGTIGFYIPGTSVAFKLRKVKIETGTSATEWTPAVEDYAGEASVAFSSIRNTTNTSSASGTLRRVGKTVNLYFSATLANALAASTWLTIGTLPSEYSPAEVIYASGAWISGAMARVYIGTAIQVWCPQAQGAGALVNGNITWFTK